MPNLKFGYLDLYDILPNLEMDYDDYYKCEKDVINPALRQLGYEFDTPAHRSGWYTGEGDSFGPLSRCLSVRDKNGEHWTVVYG